MKQYITSTLQQLLADRPLFSLVGFFLFGCLVLIVYVAFNIHASELQVVNHYTSFGTTNFYRDKWYYLLSFIGFVIVMAVAHIALLYKILDQKGRDIAVAFVWLSIVLLFITAATAYQVLKIAALT